MNAVAAFELGKAGLQGDLTPYAGDNPDAGDLAMTYVSPRGHELVISGAGTESAMVHHFDPSEENTFALGGFDGRSPAETVKAINEVVWELEVRDAFDSGFRDGEVYELREAELGRSKDGGNFAQMEVSDEDGNRTTVHHDYDTGVTTIFDEDGQLDGMTESITMDAIVIDMAEEPEDGNLQVAMARAFERIRANAANVPGSGDFISPRTLTDHEARLHANADAVRRSNEGMSTQIARNISAVGSASGFGTAYLGAAKKANESGNHEASAMLLISTTAIMDLPEKMLDHKDDTAKMREDIEQARAKLRRDGSLLDGFAPSGRQPIFQGLDDQLQELDRFISGP